MIRFFAAHPTIANLLMLSFFAIGLAFAPSLQRETFPRIEPRKVQIAVAWPGARPEDVEEALCRRIEDAVSTVDNVYEIQCRSRENSAVATVEMVEGNELDRFMSDIKTEVEAIDDFPDKVETPIVTALGRTDFVADIAITGPDDPTQLKAYAEDVKARMLAMGGIPKIDISGFSEHQIRIEVSDAARRRHGLSLDGIAAVIARQSLDLPAGSLTTSDGEILIRIAEERKRLDDFLGLIVVSATSGGQVRLGDIATISDRFDKDEVKTLFGGKRAAMLKITKTPNDDTLKVIERVNSFLDKEKRSAPASVDLVITNDGSTIVRDRLQLVSTNAVQGLVLVFLVMLAFFGFRYAFWIAMGLPVSFMGGIAIMVLLGYSLNMLTMVALLIVIGLLMDDAIVLSENIASKFEKGAAPLDAAVEGTRQVAAGVLASFGTTAAMFGSLGFLKGDIGAVLKVIPVVMLAVLAISLIEAFLILPNHLAHSLQRGSKQPGLRARIMDRFMFFARERVVFAVASLAVRWRYLTLGLTVLAMMLSVAAITSGRLKFSAFPDLEGNVIEARLQLPQGTPLGRTEAVVAGINAALQRTDEKLRPQEAEQASLVKNVTVLFNTNADANEEGSHVATLRVDLRDSETRNARNEAIIATWREETGLVPDVLSLKFTKPSFGPAGRPIDIRLKGTDLAALEAASDELQNWLRRYQGVHDVAGDLRPGKPEFQVRLTENGHSLGLDARLIADQLRSAYFGRTVSDIQVGVESYEIDVRLSERDRDSRADLDYFSVATPTGERVPLSAAAILTEGRGYSMINRVNGVRTISITAELNPRVANTNEVLRDTSQRFLPDLQKRHPGVEISLEGERKEAGKTQMSMLKGFGLGLFAVFLLLSFQFRSYVEPIIVMVVIPLALIGAVIGHILLGFDFTMPSMLGFVALAGVAVNDSILLIEFIKEHHGTGEFQSVAEAAPEAARSRFRAILLTSLTTVVGLMPILAETSLQAQVLQPLITSLAFGITASTLIVLFVVPAIYAILDDFGLTTLARERKAALKAGH